MEENIVVAVIAMILIFNVLLFSGKSCLSVCEKLEEREAEGPTQQWINTTRDWMPDMRPESDLWP